MTFCQKFLRTHRKNGLHGWEYQPETITSFHCSNQRYLTEKFTFSRCNFCQTLLQILFLKLCLYSTWFNVQWICFPTCGSLFFLSCSHHPKHVMAEAFRSECYTINHLLPKLTWAILGNTDPWSFLHGPQASIPQYSPRAWLVRVYC